MKADSFFEPFLSRRGAAGSASAGQGERNDDRDGSKGESKQKPAKFALPRVYVAGAENSVLSP
jgi:hypothetical protein